MLWFRAVIKTDSTDLQTEDKLILWKDLIAANPHKIADLFQMVLTIFKDIATSDDQLLPFVNLCLKRAMS